MGPAPAADSFIVGTFASSGTTDRDGTLFSFAGGSSVGTTVSVRDDDTMVVRGDARIGDGLGGRLRGYDASIVELRGDGVVAPMVAGTGSLQAVARDVRSSGVQADGANRRVLECPASRHGYVVSQFLVTGLGRNVGPTADPALEGGVPVFVSEIIPFHCGHVPANGPLAGPGDGPTAALVCGWTRSAHQPFTSTRDGQAVTSNSSMLRKYLIVTLGLSPDEAAAILARIGDANGGEYFSVRLEGFQLGSAWHPDAMAWIGEAQMGIDTYGPKRDRDLQLTADGHTFDLAEQQRSLIGDAFEVGPSQKPVTNCPGFDFTAETLPAVFPDGFASGDVTAWSEPIAD